MHGVTKANLAFAKRYPGPCEGRQPIHVMYGGAHLFRADTTAKLGALAIRSLDTHAPSAAALGTAIGWTGPAAVLLIAYERMRAKLLREPVEDYRIDFEDGYGNRSDDEEDGHAISAAAQVAQGVAAGTLPPFIGIRIKAFTEELRKRGIRTLRLFLDEMLAKTGGRMPPNFVVTLPKVTVPEQITGLRRLLKQYAIGMEIMIEAPQSLARLQEFADAGNGRLAAAHFGAYDYTAACGITAGYQDLRHPACDFARAAMQAAFAGTGIALADGATNLLPVGDADAIAAGWSLHYQNIRHSLASGFYRSWDLHPAQLPVRYAATYTFFLESMEIMGDRLRGFREKAAQATRLGNIFDDAATFHGLLNHFTRALDCGAITNDEFLLHTGEPALQVNSPEQLCLPVR